MKRRRLIVVAAVVVASSGAVIAVAANDSPPNPRADRPPADQIDSRLRANFGLFRRAERPSDAPSQDRRSGELHRRYGLNPDLARRAVAAQGEQLTVTAGNHALCVQATWVDLCQDVDVAVQGKMVAVSLCSRSVPAGHIRVTALVPDGVGTVAFTGRSPDVLAREEVHDNAVVADVRVDGPDTYPARMQLGADGSRSVPLAVPTDAATIKASCAHG